jgi:hypothetical protein
MAAIQFIHHGGYGKTPGRGRKSHETIAGVTAEAGRVPGNAPHVRYPQVPRILYGVSPTEVGEMAIRLSSMAKDRQGHRLRCDGVVLTAGVATYPIPVADMGEFASDYDTYSLWVSRTLEWLLTEHGTSLVSVVEHTDEGHLHLHFFTLPEVGPDGRLNFDPAHAGRSALNAAVDRKVQPAAQQAAYVAAMIDYQDRYHRDVSKFFRHERCGPGRKRVERALHKVNRQAEADLARSRAKLEFEYWCPVTDEEANERSRHVSKVDFIAVAAEQHRLDQMEIERLRQRLRDHGIGDRDDPEPSPAPQFRADLSQALAFLDQLNIVAQPESEASVETEPDLWTQQRRMIYAKVDRLLSKDLKGPPKFNAAPPSAISEHTRAPRL